MTILDDIRAAKEHFRRARHYEPNFVLVSPHGWDRAMLAPEHLLDCARCRRDFGLARVRAAVGDRYLGGWSPTIARLVRMLRHPLRLPEGKRLPLPGSSAARVNQVAREVLGGTHSWKHAAPNVSRETLPEEDA